MTDTLTDLQQKQELAEWEELLSLRCWGRLMALVAEECNRLNDTILAAGEFGPEHYRSQGGIRALQWLLRSPAERIATLEEQQQANRPARKGRR